MSTEYNDFRLKGSIIGLLLGDAIGIHYDLIKHSNKPIDVYDGPGTRQAGTYSNAAAFAICSMASINELSGIDLDDIMERFQDCYMGGYLNYDDDDYFLGETSIQAIKNYSNGMPTDRCGLKDDSKLDDEVIARILPIALYFSSADLETLVQQCEKACRLTHNNYFSQVCCTIYALLIRNILLDKPEKVFDILHDYYDKKFAQHQQALVYIQKSQKLTNTDIIGTFWTAWNVFSKNETNFENCMRETIHYGSENAHSVGAISGSLCGLSNGLNIIPNHWLAQLKLTAEVMEVIESFVHKIKI